MKTQMMSSIEQGNAAYNIRLIESQMKKVYGKNIPAGYLDATRYGNRLLTSSEANTIAYNIYESQKYNRVSGNSSASTGDIPEGAALIFVVLLLLCFPPVVLYFILKKLGVPKGIALTISVIVTLILGTLLVFWLFN